MPSDCCPNYDGCPVVHTRDIVADTDRQRIYVETYCRGKHGHWENCKRFLTKEAWNFCPDFVLPDMAESTEEILDIYEEQSMSNEL